MHFLSDQRLGWLALRIITSFGRTCQFDSLGTFRQLREGPWMFMHRPDRYSRIKLSGCFWEKPQGRSLSVRSDYRK
jgi:hypothetical protein